MKFNVKAAAVLQEGVGGRGQLTRRSDPCTDETDSQYWV